MALHAIGKTLHPELRDNENALGVKGQLSLGIWSAIWRLLLSGSSHSSGLLQTDPSFPNGLRKKSLAACMNLYEIISYTHPGASPGPHIFRDSKV
jgi:hypothetical protein